MGNGTLCSDYLAGCWSGPACQQGGSDLLGARRVRGSAREARLICGAPHQEYDPVRVARHTAAGQFALHRKRQHVLSVVERDAQGQEDIQRVHRLPSLEKIATNVR